MIIELTWEKEYNNMTLSELLKHFLDFYDRMQTHSWNIKDKSLLRVLNKRAHTEQMKSLTNKYLNDIERIGL